MAKVAQQMMSSTMGCPRSGSGFEKRRSGGPKIDMDGDFFRATLVAVQKSALCCAFGATLLAASTAWAVGGGHGAGGHGAGGHGAGAHGHAACGAHGHGGHGPPSVGRPKRQQRASTTPTTRRGPGWRFGTTR